LFPDKVSLTHSRSLSLSHSLSLFLSALIGSWYWFLAFCDRFLAYVTAYNCRAHGLTLCPESCPERALLGHTSQKRALKEPCWDARLLNKLPLSLSLSLTHTHTHTLPRPRSALLDWCGERETNSERERERETDLQTSCAPPTHSVSLSVSLCLSPDKEDLTPLEEVVALCGKGRSMSAFHELSFHELSLHELSLTWASAPGFGRSRRAVPATPSPWPTPSSWVWRPCFASRTLAWTRSPAGFDT